MRYFGATKNELFWSYKEWVILELQRMSYFGATENELFWSYREWIILELQRMNYFRMSYFGATMRMSYF